MIDIVIPTFKRLNSQITLSNIPESLLKDVTLVVQPQEELEAKVKELKEKGYQPQYRFF